MERYDTLKAWGIDKNTSVPKKHHEQVVKELTTQVYKAYKRIMILREENDQLRDQLGK
jgi:hypothetical protein